MNKLSPTLLGYVGAVTGSTVSVRQSPTIASGFAIIGGRSYRIGQVGSFVRIPQGYQNLYGIISQVGANAIPEALREVRSEGERWLTIQLVGEIIADSFERGISQYPNVHDDVHLVTEDDLARIYGNDATGQVTIGRLANAEGIPVRVDLDKLVTRHSAVLGSTGSGKSTTVASLLRSIASGSDEEGSKGFPSARILLLDIHGEYGQALKSVAKTFRVNPNQGEHQLNIPYWALDPGELFEFLFGRIDDKVLTQVFDRLLTHKTNAVEQTKLAGVDLSSLTSDSPIPYSLKQLWLELIDLEVKTWLDMERTQPALEQHGDAETLRLPKYKPPGVSNKPPFLNQPAQGLLGIRRPLDQMRARLLDKQYDFLLRPGKWEPKLDGTVELDISDLLLSWLGHDKPITILDLSGIPSIVQSRLIGAILRIVYDGLFWGREKSEGGINRPLLVVMEEAHRYLSSEAEGSARAMVQRVVKEGRKFGLGAMIVSQRPSEVDETILSQCGTFIALRLSNSSDRGKVQAALPDSLAGVVDSLPILRTGEAIVIGEAARLPIRCRVTLPSEANRPSSADPEVAKNWAIPRTEEDYTRIVASWRAQNPRWTAVASPTRKRMDREAVTSSSIAAIGYEAGTETLEVEFTNGSVYQYYNVPQVTYDQFMASGSIGQFFHANIRNAFPNSRVG